MKQVFLLFLLMSAKVLAGLPDLPPMRPPAVPLVVHDPYFSIWSRGDKLTDVDTTHWTGRGPKDKPEWSTGKPHRLSSILEIDGSPYRVMGAAPADIPPLEQKSLSVLPTRTICTFEGAGVELTLTFLTPALPEDIAILSRPLTYVTHSVRSTDGRKHAVTLRFGASGEITVNEPHQKVVWSREEMENLTALKIGSESQSVLGASGDDLRIDWGYLYLSAPTPEVQQAEVTGQSGEKIAPPAAAEAVVAEMKLPFGKVGAEAVSRWLMLAYDDLYAIQYMTQNLRPFWRRNGWEAADLLKAAARDYEPLQKRCTAFDGEFMNDLVEAGGPKFAQIGALAYRQCFAAGKFAADANGQPLQFCKENHSNGCISTSDVFYPMSPQFLLFGPSLAKSFVVPFMNYAAGGRWKFPFAPHDLGRYPHANGQIYGDGENGLNKQMPVEESGNMLLLMTAIAQMEGHADFAGLYWNQLETWAGYLKEKGFDPENQLCTDDFAGHLAHNVNLSAKAICALGAFAKLCEMRGEKDRAAEYEKTAREFAQRWVKEADDGDHFRLAFDQPGTWSQKYNLIWDRILGLNLFPESALRKEMDFYRKTQQKFGLPLDSRQEHTKLDWLLWTATLTQNRDDFKTLTDPVFDFINKTPDRGPLTDFYWARDAGKKGFTARPVVGGVFAQLLHDKTLWKKWSSRDRTKAAGWAPLPKPPRVETIIPAADQSPTSWRYTTENPGPDWMKPGFDDSSWGESKSGFGSPKTPNSIATTLWTTSDIWLRKEMDFPHPLPNGEIRAWIYHDEDVEVFINGIPALNAPGNVTDYTPLALSPQGKAALKPGKNSIAVHCHQSRGGQYIDLGFVTLVTP